METLLEKPDHKYAEVAERIELLIDKRVMKVGDKLLSVRALSKEQGISLSTAFQAYYLLESKGLIEARPQSGYYVKYSPEHILDLPNVSEPVDDAVPVSVDDMINSVYVDLNTDKLLNFFNGRSIHRSFADRQVEQSDYARHSRIENKLFEL